MGCGASRPLNKGDGRSRNFIDKGTESEINSRPRPYTEAPEELLKLKSVDLNIQNNTRDHRTHKFDVVARRQELIVRRGQHFFIEVEFDREYNPKTDELRLVFQFGLKPKRKQGTHVELVLSDKDDKNDWGAFVKSIEGNRLNIGVISRATCAVGKWSLILDVVKRSDRNSSVYRYTHSVPIYILFNPWCKDDNVYMMDENLLGEYIMAESGQIYAGNGERISPKPWTFGQFEGSVFDCVMYLLENSGVPDHSRGNPVVVARKMSAMVNSPDDEGVLIGNWSGDYAGGTSPLAWTGSTAILKEYFRTKRSVKYGQCWVFSGVLTTVCRALGIPTRSITNFQSAHDTDGSITIDKHFDQKGNPLDRLNRDSIWNFHVWNDVWMARPDLPPGYGGWQAIDATPQETSDGMYQMGPMSLLALKRGEVFLPFDGLFAFGEINGDVLYWMESDDGSLDVVDVKKKQVGVKISTKAPLGNSREDVTNQYKYDEGTDEERAAVHRAHIHSSRKAEEVYKVKAKDVSFTLTTNPDTFMGDVVKFGLDVKNNSNEQRTIWGNLTFSSSYYTGVTHKQIKRQEIDYIVLDAQKGQNILVEVEVNEYLDKLTDHCICMISSMCFVQETKQTFAQMNELRLRKPHLKMKAPNTAKVGERLEVKVSFDNPLPVTLTNCELRVECPGAQEPVIYKQPDVPANQTYTGSFELRPFKAGATEIVAYFNCTQILSVNVSQPINIEE